MAHRPIGDTIVVILAAMVAVAVIVLVVGIVVLEVVDPATETDALVARIGRLIDVALVAVIAYALGRRT